MRQEPPSPKWVGIWLITVGPVAVAVSAAVCLFFLLATPWKAYAVLVTPPTVLYLWVVLAYWLGYSQVNRADKLATLAATTGIYVFLFAFYGFAWLGRQDRVLGLLVLLTIMAGAFELRRWRRRVSYIALAVALCALAVSRLLTELRGPSLLYAAPALLLHQALLLLVLCVPAELHYGGAGDPLEVSDSGLSGTSC